MKKYELTDEAIKVTGRTLYRIRALIDFGGVKAGQLGGYIEKEENLAQDGDAWVDGDARVGGNAWVGGNARVGGNADIKSSDDYLCFKGFGSCNRNTTVFRTKNADISVRCGCFYGTLSEFEAKVKSTHGSSKYAREYLACIAAAKIHFGMEE